MQTPSLHDEKKEEEEPETEEIPLSDKQPTKPKDEWKKALGVLTIFPFLAIIVPFTIRFLGRKKEEEKQEENR